MDNYTYGEVFEREAPRASRPSRSTAQFRTSYNEDLMSKSIGDEGDDGDAHQSSFPCANFLSDTGILEDFLLLVNRVGLTTCNDPEKYPIIELHVIFFFTSLWRHASSCIYHLACFCENLKFIWYKLFLIFSCMVL
jgi:hypothetical protein